MSLESRQETYERVLTKKWKNINLSTTGSAHADLPIWVPPANEKYILLFAFAILRSLTGNPDLWRIELEVANADLVASVAPTAESVGSVKTLTVIGSLPFDNDNPITLTTILDGVATVAMVDLMLVAVKLNDVP